MIHLLVCVVQLAIAKNNIIKLQEENQHLRSENSVILLKTQQQFEVHMCTITSVYVSPSKNRLLLTLVTDYDYKGEEMMRLSCSSFCSPRWPRGMCRWRGTHINSPVKVWMRCTTKLKGS